MELRNHKRIMNDTGIRPIAKFKIVSNSAASKLPCESELSHLVPRAFSLLYAGSVKESFLIESVDRYSVEVHNTFRSLDF